MKTDLSINSDLARQILTGFIRSEITRVGFSRAVIGLSGGIDSAVSCYLAAKALGPQNVLAVRMPYKTSSPDSLDHALLVIEETGVNSITIEITPMADPLIALTPPDAHVRHGNIMARMRMIVLYDQSEDFKGLVVGTSNKTEILLGYSTLYGDSACAINPIGDLYKTQLRQLAADLGIPSPIINKPPSADLWAGQTDEDELGFTYAKADQLLHLLVDERHSPEECVQAGFDKTFLRNVVERIQRFHYKRMMPPIAKLTPDQAIVQAREGVWLLAGGRSLAGLKRVIARKDFGGERTLAESLASLDGQYDYVLVDTAPAWDTLTVNALFFASEVLIPVALEVMALQGMLEFVRSLKSVQQYHPELTLRYIVPTFMDRRVKKSEEILGQLRGHFEDLVCDPIRYNVRLSEAPGYGQTIFEYAPRSSGAQDYQQLTERIVQDG